MEEVHRLKKQLKSLRDEVQTVDANLRQMYCFITEEIQQVAEILEHVEELLKELRRM